MGVGQRQGVVEAGNNLHCGDVPDPDLRGWQRLLICGVPDRRGAVAVRLGLPAGGDRVVRAAFLLIPVILVSMVTIIWFYSLEHARKDLDQIGFSAKTLRDQLAVQEV